MISLAAAGGGDSSCGGSGAAARQVPSCCWQLQLAAPACMGLRRAPRSAMRELRPGLERAMSEQQSVQLAVATAVLAFATAASPPHPHTSGGDRFKAKQAVVDGNNSPSPHFTQDQPTHPPCTHIHRRSARCLAAAATATKRSRPPWTAPTPRLCPPPL